MLPLTFSFFAFAEITWLLMKETTYCPERYTMILEAILALAIILIVGIVFNVIAEIASK